MPLKIIWTERFSVGDALLDAQHQKLLIILQRASECMEDDSPRGRSLFHSILNDVCVYTATHFRTEEALLSQCHYPELEAHKAEHVAFLAQITELAFVASQGVVLKADLHRSLFLWVSHHILESDMEYRPYLEKKLRNPPSSGHGDAAPEGPDKNKD